MGERGHEIERKYLLRGMPVLPAGAEPLRIEQGYLDPAAENDDAAAGAQVVVSGRIRRTIRPDGTILYHHTIKRGSGLVREEIERPISRKQFEDAWPRTAGRRLRKTRHRISDGPLVWEIDDFGDRDLVLAEVELPDAGFEVVIPEWLRPFVIREVTDDATFSNFNLAAHSAANPAMKPPRP